MGIYTKSTKHCNKCNTTKLLAEFPKNKSKKGGYQGECKKCARMRVKLHTENNKENKKIYQKEYYKNNKEKLLLQKKEYNLFKKTTKDVLIQKQNKHIKNCSKCDTVQPIANFSKDKYHKDGLQTYCKSCAIAYRNKNKEKMALYRKDYMRNRRSIDPLLSLRDRIARGINKSLKKKGYTKTSMTYEILGCSYEEFKVYIESKFLEGMSWDNRSEWHLDHIIPVSYGLTEEEILALNHHSNFQPLWAIDNLRKSNRYIG